MDTQTQIDRLIELAIIQRSELKQLVEQLPQLREHLNSEVEKVFDETEPQLRAELEEWTTKQTADKTAALGVALETKIADLAKSLEVSTQARYNAIIAEREENARLAAQAEAKIAEHAASLPGAVKEIVSAELARFPRAGEIEQLRKEFAEPRGLNPRGKWQVGETYNKLDFVTINGDSYASNIDNNRTRPSRSSADWTLVAARGTGGGGGPTSLSELTTVPSDGDVLIGSGTSWVTSNLTAGAGVSITVGPGAITISATDGDITLDDGTAASPSLHFTNDPDTGIYRPAANTLGISVSGTQVAYFDENGLTVPSAGVVAGGSIHAGNGNANNPSLSFDGDQDTGFFRHQPNEIGIALGGTQYATLTSTTFSITPVVTMASSLRVNGTTDSSSKDTGAIVTEGGLGVEKSANIGGNLTVSGGTVDNSPASGGPLFRSIRPANTGSAAFASIPNGALSASNVEWYSGLIGSSGDYKIWAYNGSTNTFAFSSTPAGNVTLSGNLTVSGTGTSTFNGNTLFNPSTAGNNYTLWKSGSVFVGGIGDGSAFGTTANDFVVHGYTGSTKIYSNSVLAATFASTGNVLVGTTTDSGNGKLQLASHTTSAGGIGFGTATSLYTEAAGTLSLNHSAGDARLYFYNTGVAQGKIESASSNFYVTASAGSLILRSGGPVTALTLDSSQNATFAGKATATQFVATAGSSAGGSVWASSGAGLIVQCKTGSVQDFVLTNPGATSNVFEVPTGTVTMKLGGALRLNNAYTAGAPTATGYVTIQDSAGNTYKVLVGT